jgi:hypothetical protein
MKAFAQWQKDNFVGTGQTAVPNLEGVCQVARSLRNLYAPIGSEQPDTALNPQSRRHFQVWPIILHVFDEGGIPGARKTWSRIFVIFFHFTVFTSDARSGFSKSSFTPSGKNRENFSILFMNDIYMFCDDRDQIGTKQSDAES